MKSSPPAPNILRSVLRMERFNVVTRPIGIIAIVAILLPTYGSLRHIDSSKTQINQLSCAARLILPRDAGLKMAALDAGLAGVLCGAPRIRRGQAASWPWIFSNLSATTHLGEYSLALVWRPARQSASSSSSRLRVAVAAQKRRNAV